MSIKANVKVINFAQEMARVKREVKRLGNSKIEDKIDYATATLKQVTPVDTGEA